MLMPKSAHFVVTSKYTGIIQVECKTQ